MHGGQTSFDGHGQSTGRGTSGLRDPSKCTPVCATPRCGEGMSGEMIGVIVVTHCHLSEELIAAARLVVGEELKQFEAVSIAPSEGSEEIRKKIVTAIRRVDGGQGVLILTDMYGGTPSNISLSFLEEKKIEVITGANL